MVRHVILQFLGIVFTVWSVYCAMVTEWDYTNAGGDRGVGWFLTAMIGFLALLCYVAAWAKHAEVISDLKGKEKRCSESEAAAGKARLDLGNLRHEKDTEIARIVGDHNQQVELRKRTKDLFGQLVKSIAGVSTNILHMRAKSVDDATLRAQRHVLLCAAVLAVAEGEVDALAIMSEVPPEGLHDVIQKMVRDGEIVIDSNSELAKLAQHALGAAPPQLPRSTARMASGGSVA